MSKEKVKCQGCDKSHKPIKMYVIADDIENPVPYHPECIEELRIKLLMAMCEEDYKGCRKKIKGVKKSDNI